jgi:hypothetical protein
MIKITVDEAYAFDYHSILVLKNKNGFLSSEIVKIATEDLENSLGKDFTKKILDSKEYKDLFEANQLTFEAVDKAKDDSVKASYVDKCNYKRMIAKKNLQLSFFNTKLTENKIGYNKYDTNENMSN